MFHYEYNEDDIIIRKVDDPTGERIASSQEDFDLLLYDVIIGFLSEKKEILRHTKKLRSVDNVIQRLNAIKEDSDKKVSDTNAIVNEILTELLPMILDIILGE